MRKITNDNGKVIYSELLYVITGLLFEIQNEYGRFCREKQYGDYLEEKLKRDTIEYKREIILKDTGNIVDFIIENKIAIELKAKYRISKDDYFQIQRYLQVLNFKLGFLVNFRDKYLKPIRIVKINTDNKHKFT